MARPAARSAAQAKGRQLQPAEERDAGQQAQRIDLAADAQNKEDIEGPQDDGQQDEEMVLVRLQGCEIGLPPPRIRTPMKETPIPTA